MVTDFEQLYYQDSYRRRFDAKIQAYREEMGEVWLRLDQTAFYPEGGGQPGDKGTIHIEELCITLDVIDTQEDNGLIWHQIRTGQAPELSPNCEGLTILGEIDWERRYDFMQQHSAEHILSGLVNKHFGYDNVGFHINETLMTIDFSGPLSQDELDEMETLCNEAIVSNIPFKIDYYTHEEAEAISYRSKIDLPEAIRLVTVPGYDCCACCGTQVKMSGELGLLKIVSWMNYKGGVRLEVLAGKRALLNYRQKHDSLVKLSRVLSSPVSGVEDAVNKLVSDLEEHKFAYNHLEQRWVMALLASIKDTSGRLVILHPEASPSAHKELAKQLSLRIEGQAILCGPAENSLRFTIIGTDAYDGHAVLNLLQTNFGAKGGGKPSFISGQITGTGQEDLLISLLETNGFRTIRL